MKYTYSNRHAILHLVPTFGIDYEELVQLAAATINTGEARARSYITYMLHCGMISFLDPADPTIYRSKNALYENDGLYEFNWVRFGQGPEYATRQVTDSEQWMKSSTFHPDLSAYVAKFVALRKIDAKKAVQQQEEAGK